jgi:flagellar protein FlgJ
MKIEGITPKSPLVAAEMSPTRQREDAKLKEACQQFESLFLNQLLSEMRKTIPKSEEGGVFGDGKNQETFQGMLDEERAKAWSQTDGIGLANILYQQMRNTL